MFGDLIYVGTEKLAEEIESLITARFPDAKFNQCWDEIHGWRVEVDIPETTPEQFYKFAIREGFPRICLGFGIMTLQEPETIMEWLDQMREDRVQRWTEEDKMTWIEERGARWLNQKVEFTLLGQRVVGTVVDVLHEVCTHRWVIAEFRDGPKQVKVGAPYQAFRRIKEEDAHG